MASSFLKFFAAASLLSTQVICTPVPADNEEGLAKRLDTSVSNGAVGVAVSTANQNANTPSTSTDTFTIDWIPLVSQAHGQIASPPPKIELELIDNVTLPLAELQLPGAQLGPDGTVPIPRLKRGYASVVTKKLPVSQIFPDKRKRQNAGQHWYVTSDQTVSNTGSSAYYSLFKPYTQSSSDFSLIQTAITVPGQTAEAGWINYPDQISKPHLFTYFTTVNYQAEGDRIGGWNTEYQGWIQYDRYIFPGTVFNTSVDGGAQYEVRLEYRFFNNNWWLGVNDRWIGYYPANLYSNGFYSPSLADGSNDVLFFGEVYNSQQSITRTNMGSGEFPSKGYGKSGYMRRMSYRDTKGNVQDYTTGYSDSDTSRYTHYFRVSTGSNWGSYVFLGGPGAGNVGY